MKLYSTNYKAFTLIELLIVIVIVGVLSVGLIPRITGMQNRAKYVRVEKDFKDFQTAVFMAQTSSQKKLYDITAIIHTIGLSYTDPDLCIRNGNDMKKLSVNDVCRTLRITSLRKIEQAAGMRVGELSHLETDPRGSPYILSNGEGHTGGGAQPCDLMHLDNIHTAGPDGLANYNYFITHNSSSKDDRETKYRSIFCPNAY